MSSTCALVKSPRAARDRGMTRVIHALLVRTLKKSSGAQPQEESSGSAGPVTRNRGAMGDRLNRAAGKGAEMPGRFVIKKGTTGNFRFVLFSPRGQVIATSEAYDAKASAMAGIRSMRKLAPEATIEDLTRAGESKRKVSPKASTPASPKPARRVRARPAPIPRNEAAGAPAEREP